MHTRPSPHKEPSTLCAQVNPASPPESGADTAVGSVGPHATGSTPTAASVRRNRPGVLGPYRPSPSQPITAKPTPSGGSPPPACAAQPTTRNGRQLPLPQTNIAREIHHLLTTTETSAPSPLSNTRTTLAHPPPPSTPTQYAYPSRKEASTTTSQLATRYHHWHHTKTQFDKHRSIPLKSGRFSRGWWFGVWSGLFFVFRACGSRGVVR